MDCRKALLLLALGVLPINSGCTLFGGGGGPSPPGDPGKSVASAPAPAPQAAPEDTSGKRTPKASTCVALGKYRQDLAADGRCTPLEKQRLLDEARMAFQQALSIDPKYEPAHAALAHLYVELGDYERATAAYQKGLKAFPKQASLWLDQGIFQARRKEWEPAIASLKKAVALEPENRQYSNVLGYCLARAGRYDESLTVFGKTSGQAVACYNVARMLHHNQQDDLSRQYLQQALQANPQLAEARQLLASLDHAGIATVGFQTTEPR
jgi:tetratricopeptide (TPR) repeat protein